MVVGYEKTSFGVWGFRTLFVRLLAHCLYAYWHDGIA